ncbi:serine hydrolase domain-containing protein [Marivirga salinae]|uniref:Serine hydrolase domain-containing protein n=1 Tax=Marivirga salinarum TaxID=3059078 RepID=A0AA51RBA9_9BACT|nr:serine hydrolase domain-containing protein [Marivirga sp. BDSF4-3]WMN12001.1 serine hydrolase domain-containing protein [Marivirga sp. BDSF4-3]
MRILISILFFLVSISTYGQTDKISGILDEIDAKEHLNGVVLVGQDGQVIFQNAYGIANRSFGIENNLDTKFLIGSLTKQFTAVLVMQLVENGQLSLDEPITKYLPNFKKETGDKITIRHLLTHTHGIPNADLTDRYKPMTKEDFVKKYGEKNLEFESGAQFEYSGIVGYYLIGVIVEKVTSKDFAQLLQENILEPLDMKNTGYYSQDTIQQNLATGYIQKENSFLNAPHWDMSQSFSAAGMYSTVGDLFKWDQALRGTQLISKASFKEIFTPFNDEIRYGFAWFINDPEISGKKRLFAGHNGGANGYKSQIMRGINEDLVVIYLSNSDKYVEIRYPIIEALLSEEK